MKIIDAKPLDRFRVALRFDDGTAGTVDLSDLAGRGVFVAWLDEGFFERLSIGPNGTLQWPGELDLCPDSLYLRVVDKTPGEVFPALAGALTHA